MCVRGGHRDARGKYRRRGERPSGMRDTKMRPMLRAATLIVAAATTPLPASAASGATQGSAAAASAAATKKVRVIVRLKVAAAPEAALRGRMAGAGVGSVERLG